MEGSSIKADAARTALACLAAASERGHQKFVILQPCMGSNPFVLLHLAYTPFVPAACIAGRATATAVKEHHIVINFNSLPEGGFGAVSNPATPQITIEPASAPHKLLERPLGRRLIEFPALCACPCDC